jgi:hypothetical protein
MRRLTLVLSFLLVPAFTQAAPAARGGEPRENRHAVLTPAHALNDAERAELAASGITVGAPLANGRLIVRMRDGATVPDALGTVEPLRPERKVAASAYRAFAQGRTLAPVHVVFHKDVDYDTARQAILAAGGELDPFRVRFSPSQRVEARVPSTALAALAADDRVLAIAGARNLRVKADNAISAQISHVTELYSAPYNLTGEGVVVSLFELAEAQASHVEFGGRLIGHATGGATDDKLHATHVSGTIGASGVRPDAKGMAPAVTIHQFCIQTPCGGDDLSFLDDKDEKLQPLGVVADNNSWGFVLGWTSEGGDQVWTDGADYYGAYDLYYTAPIDEISNDKDVLFVHSAGNDGDPPQFGDAFSQHRHVNDDGDTDKTKYFCYSKDGSGSDCPATCNGGCEKVKHHDVLPFDTIGVTAAAKNVITVGAINAALEIVGFSSQGPAKDGRIKPDVVARGFSVLSSVPTNQYARANGTSMSSPAVTGIAAMLTQQWRKTFGGATPNPMQLKAIIIAGAQDLGRPGPDYTFGFGLAHAKNSADIIIADGGVGNRIRSMSFANGQGASQEFRISVPAAGPVRAVLQWNDPAIVPVSNDDEIAPVALVNDLDLKVVGPDNTTYLPWILDKAAPTANATHGRNSVDNTEMVEFTAPAAGTYRVVVTGTRVSDGPQDAVLVASVPVLIVKPCVDIHEPNDNAGAAFGNVVSNSVVSGGLCANGDLDFYKFTATKAGPVTVTVTAGDTPLRVTVTGTGISATKDVTAGSTAVLNATATTVPNTITVKIEAIGELGLNPSYAFTPAFGFENGTRRRSTKH